MKNSNGINEPNGVYAIKNIKTNRIYIGESVHVLERWQQHIYDLSSRNHYNPQLQEDYNIHGIASLEFRVLITYKESPLDTYAMLKPFLILSEAKIIDNLRSHGKKLYNIGNTLERYLTTEYDEYDINNKIKSNLIQLIKHNNITDYIEKYNIQ